MEAMSIYKVAEIFTSINGEGMHAGELAVFVRFCGCNLRCLYCDTRWANEKDSPGTLMTEVDILQLLKREQIRRVTLTGGEPLLQLQIGQLLILLQRESFLVEIETNGSVDLSPFARLREGCVPVERRIQFTMDYKLAGSGMEEEMKTENFALLGHQDTVKFVVSDESDLQRAYEISEKFGLNGRCHIILSPVFGKIDPEQIVNYMKDKKWNDARMQLQLHKLIWDPDKRGV